MIRPQAQRSGEDIVTMSTIRILRSHRRMGVAILAMAVALTAAVPVAGQLPDERLEELRDTVEFGIDEEVRSAISTLEEAEETRLNEALLARFEGSFNSRLRTDIMNFFNRVAFAGAAQAAVTVVEEFRGTDSQLVVSAVRLLGNPEIDLPRGAEDALIEAADRGSGGVSRAAIRALGEREVEDAEELLIKVVQSRTADQATREAAILALGDVGGEDAVGTLLSVAQDVQAGSLYRGYAIQSLGKIGEEDALPPLRALLSQNDAIVRSYATQAVLELLDRDRERRAVLSAALRDSLAQTRINALTWIRENGVSEMSRAVRYKVENDPDARVRAEAMDTLAALATEDYAQVLAEVALDTSRPVADRMSAMNTLIRENPGAAVTSFQEPLAEDLEDGTGALAGPLAQVLSETGGDGVGPLYETLLQKGGVDARLYALAGIERREIAGLQSTMRNLRDGDSPLHPAVRRAIERIIGAPEESEEGAPAEEASADGESSDGGAADGESRE